MKQVRVHTRVVLEDSEDFKRDLEWSVSRIYGVDELKQLRLMPVDLVIHDLKPDMFTMLDKVLSK